MTLDSNLNFVGITSESLFANSIFKRTQDSTYKVLLAMLADDRVIAGVLKNTVNMYDLGSTNSNSVISRSQVVKVESLIDVIIAPDNIREGSFNYFEKDMNNRIITRQQVIDRSGAEFAKFFKDNVGAAQITSITGDIPLQSAEQMAN